MKHIISLLSGMAVAIAGFAQVDLCGSVIDHNSKEPLSGASVVMKDSIGKIRKFTRTTADGEFILNVPSAAGCFLEVMMMGYDRYSVNADSVLFPLTVELKPGSFLLREVAVKADQIRQNGDTISYDVSSFAQNQDHTIGDVLARMPGISVDKSGKIQYQGEDINKFYIEGADLLGGKYAIATTGISHEDVGAVEVMENHQPMQVLSGISFSDKAAINLKLKNKAKAAWSSHGKAGSGYSDQPGGILWDGEVFAMAVRPDFQSLTTLKSNNTGGDITVQANDFLTSQRATGLNRYIDVSLPAMPSLDRKRVLFNRSALLSTNNLRKLGKGEIKAQIDYTYNRVASVAENVTTYFLNYGDKIITERRNGVDHSHTLSGKFIYELNQKTAFINNTLKAVFSREDVRLGISGSLFCDQTANLPDYYISNYFKLIKRFNDKHLVTFISQNDWESLPQKLYATTDNGFQRQRVSEQAFSTNQSAAFVMALKGVTISIEGGVKGYLRLLKTDLPDMPDYIHCEPTNRLHTNSFTIFATPHFEYRIKRINISLSTPVNVTAFSFDKKISHHTAGYFSPSLNLNWKVNNRINLSVLGTLGRKPMDLNLIHGYVMTDYRTFRDGMDDFHNLTSRNFSAKFTYRSPRRGIFANASMMRSWSSYPYTMKQQLYGDYIVWSYISADNTHNKGKMSLASINVGKTLDFLHGTASLNGSFVRHDTHLISENQTVNSEGATWSAGARFHGTPFRWLGFDGKFNFSSSRLSMN